MNADGAVVRPDLTKPESPSAWPNECGNAVVQRFAVAYEYPVYFTRRLFDCGNPVLLEAVARWEPERRHRLVAVVDSGVLVGRPHIAEELQRYVAHHGSHLELAAAPAMIPGGEGLKNDTEAPYRLQSWLQRLGIDRQSAVVAIGGGAVLDVVGYAAATTHRGVRLVRVPTTVLAQNDSGVGVKNGINAFGAKNFLGTFAPPFAVINDFDFIEMLPPRERRAGIAEAVKVAAIRDRGFFTWLTAAADALARFEPVAMQIMIRRGAELHLRHIATAGDPFEFGSARPLDFGHWAAHKLESLSGHALRHGEAVAIGMALDSRYAFEVGLFAPEALAALLGLLERLGFRLWDEALDARDAGGRRRVLEGLAEFREHLGGELTITLLSEIGYGIEVHEIDLAVVERAIEWLKARAEAR